MAGIIGENVVFQVEIEDNPKSILLIFDRKCDWAIVPWQDAFSLSELMERVIYDVEKEFIATDDPFTAIREQAQVQLNHHAGLVAILVDWTDRIRFSSLTAFALVGRAIRKTAQDAHLAMRGVHLLYDKTGLLRKLHNSKSGLTQHIR